MDKRAKKVFGDSRQRPIEQVSQNEEHCWSHNQVRLKTKDKLILQRFVRRCMPVRTRRASQPWVRAHSAEGIGLIIHSFIHSSKEDRVLCSPDWSPNPLGKDDTKLQILLPLPP